MYEKSYEFIILNWFKTHELIHHQSMIDYIIELKPAIANLKVTT